MFGFAFYLVSLGRGLVLSGNFALVGAWVRVCVLLIGVRWEITIGGCVIRTRRTV